MSGSAVPVSTGLRTTDLEPGFARVVDVGAEKLLMIRIGDDVRATSAWCTHARTLLGDQPVADDGLIECPMHAAVFSSSDGSLQFGPSCSALPVYDVTIGDGGTIVVHLPAASDETDARTPRANGWGAAWTVNVPEREEK